MAKSEPRNRRKKNGLKEAEIFESIDKMGVLTLKLNETSININPKLTIPENAEIYYEKAKKAKKKTKRNRKSKTRLYKSYTMD